MNKDWDIVINFEELSKITNKLSKQFKVFTPNKEDIFKAFKLCSLKDCKVVMLGQDPYPQLGIATGLLFANNNSSSNNNLSPSLEVIKEAAIDYTIPHNYPITFDNTLEDWSKQGVLLLNSALTTNINEIGSHTLLWRPFISEFLYRFSRYNPQIVYALFGKQAQSFEAYIDTKHNHILKENHPSYYARIGAKMPSTIFREINNYLKATYNEEIRWYKEFN